MQFGDQVSAFKSKQHQSMDHIKRRVSGYVLGPGWVHTKLLLL